MQVGKSTTEFDLLTVYGNGAESALSHCFDLFRDIVVIDAQEPTDTGPLQFEVSSGLVPFQKMDLVLYPKLDNGLV